MYFAAPDVRRDLDDSESDVYSVGVIAFLLLVGRLPFPGKTDDEYIHYATDYPDVNFSTEDTE